MSMTPKQANLFLSVGLGVQVILGFLVISVIGVILNKSNQDYKNHSYKTESNKELLENLAELDKSYQQIKPLIPYVTAALPQDKHQSELLGQVENLAQAKGVVMEGFSFPQIQQLEKQGAASLNANNLLGIPEVKYIQGTFNIAGDYEKVMDMLKDLEQMERYVELGSVTLQKDPPPENKRLKVSFDVQAYYKP